MLSYIGIFLGSLIFNFIFIENLHYIKSYDYTTCYFLLHVLTNMAIILISLPYALTLLDDPLNFENNHEEYNYISNCYILLISLHSIHMFYLNKTILWDEKFHHYVTIIFWVMSVYIEHPLYSVSLINLSGLPGGITYLMLFLKNLHYISPITEKKISMKLNIWIRAPFTLIFTTLMYCDMIYSEYTFGQKFCIYFMMGFNIYNGIHFMENIIKSYYKYENKINNSKYNLKI